MADQEAILAALRTVKDPELNVNVVDLGLVYTIQTHDDEVDVEMTLTSPACPAGPEILRNAVRAWRPSRASPRRTSSWSCRPPGRPTG